ncbi:hyaluronate lyase, partial [Streptomyces sp. NPDC059656]
VGQRMLTLFEAKPGLLHAAITGFRPAWRAFARITRGSTTLADLVRTHPLARRALHAMDARQAARRGGRG